MNLDERYRLILLPGFLGEAQDFDPLIHQLAQRSNQLASQTPFSKVVADAWDWMDEASYLLQEDFDSLGSALWHEIQNRRQPGESLGVLGYSLGGRMALALRQYLKSLTPQPHVHFVFVSTNPGLAAAADREARFRNDSLWAGRFRSEEWSSLMKDWNAQGVFAGSIGEPMRSRRKSQRELLAKCLMQWSLAKQPDYRPELLQKADYLWVTGAKDSKFTDLAQGLQNTKTIMSASHRVHLDAPEELAMMVLKDIQRFRAEVLPIH